MRDKAATVLIDKDGWIVGLAEENVGGYSRLNYGPFETDREAQKLADIINEAFGHTKKRALLIALSSMYPLSDMAHAARTASWMQE